MEIEKSYLYTHLGHSVYSDIEKIDNAIDLIVESMIAYKDNELKKLRVTDVSVSVCEIEKEFDKCPLFKTFKNGCYGCKYRKQTVH